MNKENRIASGEIIGVINSDDWYNEGAVDKVVNCFEKTIARCICGYDYNTGHRRLFKKVRCKDK